MTAHRLLRAASTAGLAVALAVALVGCAPGTLDQEHFLDAAGSLPAPESSAVLDHPTQVCAPLTSECDDPAVIATWSPAPGAVSATEYCRTFLEWAGEMGVTKVWAQRELDWQGWYEPGIHAMVIAGDVATAPVGETQTLTECAIAITRTLAPTGPDGQRDRVDVVGVTGVPGVAGGLLVVRLMPPRSIDDAALRDTGEPYMIVAYLTLV